MPVIAASLLLMDKQITLSQKYFIELVSSYLSPLQAVQVQAHFSGSHTEHFRQTPNLQSRINSIKLSYL